MKEIIKYGLILMIVCVIAAVSLAYTYSKTKPLIDKRAAEIAEKTKREVLPGVYSFKEVVKDKQTFYIGYDKKGNKIGTVVKISTRGYGGPIEMMVGIKNNGTVSGVNILSHLETPGLGAKIENKEFIEQFNGKRLAEIILKKDDCNGEIDAITAATISSRAVTDGVKEATKLIEKIEGKKKE